MIIDCYNFDSLRQITADVHIIGAGGAGVVLARELILIGKIFVLLGSGGGTGTKNQFRFYTKLYLAPCIS